MEDSDMRPPATRGDLPASRDPRATTVARTTTSTRMVLGSIIGLLLMGAIWYYFAGRDDVTDFASRNQTSEGPQVRTAPRPLNGAEPPRQTASPEVSSTAAPSPVEETTLVPRAVTTSRILQSDDQSPITANERPANQAAVPSRSPMTDRATALTSDEILVVQRSRANIRTEPSRTGRVIGTATKGTQVKVISRSQNWIEVEVGAARGWISGGLLGLRADR